jgi:glycerophosphoryl diester phosphodiesterase
MQIFAHRGSSAEAPENTISAFKLAIEQGADGIELDVQLTSDGQPVCIHDEMLDRTTNGKGLVFHYSYDQISKLDAGYKFEQYRGEPVPLLSQVMELLAPTNLLLNIELKNNILTYEGMERKVVELVRTYQMQSRVNISSFNHYSLVEVHRLAPEIETAILYDSSLYKPWNYAESIGAKSLHPQFYSITEEIIKGAHAAKMQVRPYTVDDVHVAKSFAAMGVDAVFTNVPRLMKQAPANEKL